MSGVATSVKSRSFGLYEKMMSSLLLVVIVSSSWLGSATVSAECIGGNSVLVVPSSGPPVCLPLDDYIQLQKDASSDGESVRYCVVWYD